MPVDCFVLRTLTIPPAFAYRGTDIISSYIVAKISVLGNVCSGTLAGECRRLGAIEKP